MGQSDVVLNIENLVTSFETDEGRVTVLDRVGFHVGRGETLGLVGESGCGKSVAALSIMRLLPRPAGRIESGRIIYEGTDLLSLSSGQMHAIRGRKIAMIFQEPMTALNPVQRIGAQLGEVYRIHFPDMPEDEVHNARVEMLKRVGIPAPEKRLREYPHQMSGGMRQRIMIAMALACRPDILIADEPTTALDVTTQNQILELMRELQQDIGMSIILITHDLGVVAQMCDRVIVMYAGRIVEQAPVRDLFSSPRHPYTRGLLDSIPALDTPAKSELKVIRGMVPPLRNLPQGCRFGTRCEYVTDTCRTTDPELERAGNEIHDVACLRWRELSP